MPRRLNMVSGRTVQNIIGHQRISQITVKDGTEQELYFTFDGHGSTRVLTDLAGAMVELYAYDAYGNAIGFDPAAALTEFLYSGEQFDSKIGQQYLRQRYYDPSTGRFNRLDPFFGNHADPQSFHKYAYVHGDPIQGIDPNGLSFSSISVQVVCAIGNGLRSMGMPTLGMIVKRYTPKLAMMGANLLKGFLWPAGIRQLTIHKFTTKWFMPTLTQYAGRMLFSSAQLTLQNYVIRENIAPVIPELERMAQRAQKFNGNLVNKREEIFYSAVAASLLISKGLEGELEGFFMKAAGSAGFGGALNMGLFALNMYMYSSTAGALADLMEEYIPQVSKKIDKIEIKPSLSTIFSNATHFTLNLDSDIRLLSTIFEMHDQGYQDIVEKDIKTLVNRLDGKIGDVHVTWK